jgi:nicotinamidase-related amidase
MSSQEISSSLAFVVIDMQESFLNSIQDKERLINRVSFAIEAASLLGIRIIATEQMPEKLGSTHPDIKKLLKDSPVFHKSSFSAFQADGLEDFLRQESIEHLMISGLEVPICIYQSCIDLINAEKDITVMSDCVSGRRAEDIIPVKDALIQHGCHWLPSETIFYSILNNAKHPEFKSFTKLVKKYS